VALTREEREAFLAEPHIAALSVAAGPNRGPLSVPVWYQYAPGGDVWLMTGTDSRKARLINAAGRFSLLVERIEPTIRYVSVEGPVTAVAPATREQLRELAARYLPPEKVDGYVEFAWAEHGDQSVVTLRPERWVSSDLGTV
jgi:nitroimidazol reductase NimA-like FMN-containing flavoprotein (pyridoxamine 5'-phosphate oxidase superfamily)